MSDGEGGKKGGILAAGIAGIGMLLARGADDCARLGARGGGAVLGGASVADDVARGVGRGASNLGDDALRGVGRGSSNLGDDALRGTGRAGALGEATPRGGVVPGSALDDELRATGLVEESMAGGSRSGEIADEIAKNGLEITIENLPLGPDDDDDEGDAPGTARLVGAAGARTPLDDAMRWLVLRRPTLVPVVPTTPAGYKRVFGKAPGEADLEGLESGASGEVKERGLPELLDALSRWSKANPIGVVGYAAANPGKGQGIRLALPAGGAIDDDDLHRRCLDLGTTCVVLACDPAAGARCALAASAIWMSARGAATDGPSPRMRAFARALLTERAGAEGGEAIAISRVERSPDGAAPRVVRSRIRAGAGPAKEP